MPVGQKLQFHSWQCLWTKFSLLAEKFEPLQLQMAHLKKILNSNQFRNLRKVYVNDIALLQSVWFLREKHWLCWDKSWGRDREMFRKWQEIFWTSLEIFGHSQIRSARSSFKILSLPMWISCGTSEKRQNLKSLSNGFHLKSKPCMLYKIPLLASMC